MYYTFSNPYTSKTDYIYLHSSGIDRKIQDNYLKTGKFPKRFTRRKRKLMRKILRKNWYRVVHTVSNNTMTIRTEGNI